MADIAIRLIAKENILVDIPTYCLEVTSEYNFVQHRNSESKRVKRNRRTEKERERDGDREAVVVGGGRL